MLDNNSPSEYQAWHDRMQPFEKKMCEEFMMQSRHIPITSALEELPTLTI